MFDYNYPQTQEKETTPTCKTETKEKFYALRLSCEQKNCQFVTIFRSLPIRISMDSATLQEVAKSNRLSMRSQHT